MRKSIYAFVLALGYYCAVTVSAQNVNNAGFENWENAGTESEEPTEWNSFKTASGLLSSFGVQQVKRSTVARPGSSGIYSALIWSRSIMTVVANGNMTTGQINMGSSTPSNPDNYNITHVATPAFNEALGASPDSIVFWVKFVPANSGGSDQARMNAVIHDNYDYRDPNAGDPNASAHIVGNATLNFPSTGGQWERKSIAFNYSGPASSPDYILITFATNITPGGGSAGDSLYIDDIEMIYNGIGADEYTQTGFVRVFPDLNARQLMVKMDYPQPSKTAIRLYDMVGRTLYCSDKFMDSGSENIDISSFVSGIYFVDIRRADGLNFTRKFIVD